MRTYTKQFAIVLLSISFSFFSCCGDDDGSDSNQDPTAFNLITIIDGEVDVEVIPTFSWSASTDADEDTITYDLLLDTTSNPTTVIASAISATSFTPVERLPVLETLFWKVIARDGKGGIAESEVFSFTTRDLIIPTSPVIQSNGFVARRSHATSVFNNQLFITGGRDINGDPLDDVWSSTNGTSWTQISQTDAFPERESHTSEVFNESLLLIGGLGSSRFNDVWQSTDAAASSWTDITNNSFTQREFFDTAVFDDKLWLTAGFDGNNLYFKEVWSSNDGGINWEMAVPQFSGRSNHSTVVFNNKLWVIGGKDGDGFLNDVWSSDDGITWEQVTQTNAFSARCNHKVVTYGGQLWVIGGMDTNGILNNIWVSNDGSEWKQIATNLTFLERAYFTATVFDTKIWIMGGEGEDDAQNDIWILE